MKISEFFLSENFPCLIVKFSIDLNMQACFRNVLLFGLTVYSNANGYIHQSFIRSST